LVKSPHPIDEIAARISRANGGGVRLTHESAGLNGSRSDQVLSPSEATVAALSQPIDFPPLAAGIVPGDRVAIAIDESIPCVGEIARGAIRALENAGVEHDNMIAFRSLRAMARPAKFAAKHARLKKPAV
jgi:hypothetical protein